MKYLQSTQEEARRGNKAKMRRYNMKRMNSEQVQQHKVTFFEVFGLNKSVMYFVKVAQFLFCRKTDIIAPWRWLGWIWL